MKAKFHTPDPLDYLDGICSNSHTLKLAHSLQVMLSYPNPDLLKCTYSPQGMLSLIDQTGCSVMKRKDGECPDPEVKLYYRGGYRRFIGKPVANIDYAWGDNENMINSTTVPEAKLHKRYNILSFHYVRSMISRGYILTKHYSGNIAALFLDNTLEVDVSTAEESIFGILGSEKRSEKPMNGTHVCGQTIVETGMYTMVRRLLLVQ